MRVIGIVGKIGSGKDTAAEYLNKKYSFKSVNIGDLVRKEAKNKKLVPTRINLTRVSKEFTDKFGKDYWSKRAIKKIKSFKGSKFVITGIRRLEDYERISSTFKNFEFYLIDAKPKLRFKRMRKRARPGDPKTYLQFLKQEYHEFRLYGNFNKTLSNINSKIDNNKTRNALYKNLDKII